jgi:hypothetical protein
MPVEACGFILPDEVVRVISDNLWTAYTEDDRLPPDVVEAAFGEAADSLWRFYGLDELRVHTEDWRRLDDPSWFGVAPDDIDPAQAVLIGELGYERPFALDYRSGCPVVRLMTVDDRWVEVAESPAALLDALGIEGGCSSDG